MARRLGFPIPRDFLESFAAALSASALTRMSWELGPSRLQAGMAESLGTSTDLIDFRFNDNFIISFLVNVMAGLLFINSSPFYGGV